MTANNANLARGPRTTHQRPSDRRTPRQTPLTETVVERTIETFNLLSNETRLEILLALWDAENQEPPASDRSSPVLSFSDLYDRVEIRDSGNFYYHLDRLTDHLLTEAPDGYQLRNPGRKVVEAIIAGVGFEDRTLVPTEIERACHRCGGAVELSYKNGYLYQTCTECKGQLAPDYAGDAPAGTLVRSRFDPAGLDDRTTEELYVAGSIDFLRTRGSLARGICPECSGSVASPLAVCEAHETVSGAVCSSCGTPWQVEVNYICSSCKYGANVPVQVAVHDHPAIVAFCYEHGLESTYGLDDSEACNRLWDDLMAREQTLVSTEPVRIRISVPADEATLHLTLDQDLNVLDATESGANRDALTP